MQSSYLSHTEAESMRAEINAEWQKIRQHMDNQNVTHDQIHRMRDTRMDQMKNNFEKNQRELLVC